MKSSLGMILSMYLTIKWCRSGSFCVTGSLAGDQKICQTWKLNCVTQVQNPKFWRNHGLVPQIVCYKHHYEYEYDSYSLYMSRTGSHTHSHSHSHTISITHKQAQPTFVLLFFPNAYWRHVPWNCTLWKWVIHLLLLLLLVGFVTENLGYLKIGGATSLSLVTS